MTPQALTTLREIAETVEPERLRALVAQLEEHAAECVLLLRQNLDEQPKQLMAQLVAQFPALVTLQLHPQAETVISRIVTELKGKK